MKTIGIAAHSAEGGGLCFITACREGAAELGEHMHPTIVLSAVPMALSMPGWKTGDHATVAAFLTEGIQRTADAGADFFVCPDNTAHIVLETVIDRLPIPGLHIADVVCHEITTHGWKRVALLGTDWTMTGPVYENALRRRGMEPLIPEKEARERIHAAIFDELCNGVFTASTTEMFIEVIDGIKSEGAECVVLGCTEIPLIITPENSPLPVLDSTRLLARYAVLEAISEAAIETPTGWLPIGR